MTTNGLVAVVEEVQGLMHRSKGFETQGEMVTEAQTMVPTNVLFVPVFTTVKLSCNQCESVFHEHT